MRISRTLRLAAAGAVLLLVLPGGLDAASRLPDWAVVGEYVVDVPVGVASVSGRYGFDLGDFTGAVTLGYGRTHGRISGAGSAGEFGSYLFAVDGTWEIDDATGRARIRFADAKKDPKFTFEGLMSADLLVLEGTYTRGAGFAFLEETASGPLTLGRTPPVAAPEAFELRFAAVQSVKGRVKTARVSLGTGAQKQAPRVEATLLIYGNELLGGGRVSGKLKTAKDGTTSGKLRIKGRRWSVTLRGPVDEDGFHGVANVRSPVLDVNDVALTLPVLPGPDEPPPPPPPAPKNLLDGALARVANGLVTITRDGAAKKHFRKRADMTVQFPSTVGPSVVHATPATSGGQTPTRFYFEQRGGKTYGTATAPADVRIDIEELSLSVGGTIQFHATGETYTPEGKRIIVDVIVLARVVP